MRLAGMSAAVVPLAALLAACQPAHKPAADNHGEATPQAATQPADTTQGTAIGYALNLPDDMRQARRQADFAWWRTGPAHCQLHVCLYTYRSGTLDAREFAQRRNDIMRRNIRGATDSVYMATFMPSVRSQKALRNGRRMMRVSGLWQMEGDMMGGPFLSHCLLDSPSRRVIVAEAFVYAPDYDKTAMLQRLERVLETLHPTRHPKGTTQ